MSKRGKLGIPTGDKAAYSRHRLTGSDSVCSPMEAIRAIRISQRAYDIVRRFAGWVHVSLMGLFVFLLTYSSPPGMAQTKDRLTMEDEEHSMISSVADPCEDPSIPSALTEALHLVCGRERPEAANCRIENAIIIGFVGGYVKPNDVKHPEVLYAAYLRRRYGPAVHAEIFPNHEGKRALEEIVRQFNKDANSLSKPPEQGKAILYGHSWGAAQTLVLARKLQQRGIPVALTIQIDSVKKLGFGQDDSTVPSNVAKAVNFYQRKGLTPGQPRIIAADATQTKIVGNIRMTYEGRHIKCDNYRWLSRVFNKHHHEIENDPRVWDQVTSLIDSELLKTNADIHAEWTESPPRGR